eukprot:GFKZ01005409.1.p1 GENE.GFKZ01005409.1~~GFKZ01005409.1.p1  ORF type:complete len:229 (+),score=13.11 GFKZ01005409.1:491-1177(+)
MSSDASSTHWAGVLTQVEARDVFSSTRPPQEWEHSPFACVSRALKGASSRWSTPEQESYAVIASVSRLSHILAACDEFSLSTDHKNILYMMSPHRFDTNVARHVAHKTQRWAVRLCDFKYTIEHITGESNTWADMLTRWASVPFEPFPAHRMASLRVQFITEELPELPSIAAIAESHAKQPPGHQSEYRIDKIDDHDVRVNETGQLYMPPGDTSTQLHICVAAHCGHG